MYVCMYVQLVYVCMYSWCMCVCTAGRCAAGARCEGEQVVRGGACAYIHANMCMHTCGCSVKGKRLVPYDGGMHGAYSSKNGRRMGSKRLASSPIAAPGIHVRPAPPSASSMLKSPLNTTLCPLRAAALSSAWSAIASAFTLRAGDRDWCTEPTVAPVACACTHACVHGVQRCKGARAHAYVHAWCTEPSAAPLLKRTKAGARSKATSDVSWLQTLRAARSDGSSAPTRSGAISSMPCHTSHRGAASPSVAASQTHAWCSPGLSVATRGERVYLVYACMCVCARGVRTYAYVQHACVCICTV